MSFVSFILILSTIAILVQVYILFVSIKRCLKTKEEYHLNKNEKYYILLSLIIPPLITLIHYFIVNFGKDPFIYTLLNAIINSLINTWGLVLPAPLVSIFALAIDKYKKHQSSQQGGKRR